MNRKQDGLKLQYYNAGGLRWLTWSTDVVDIATAADE
jgi:hypothetical protein